MPGPVYSTRFLENLAYAGDASYNVPAGFVAVVRDLDAFCSPDNIPGAVYLWGALGQTIAYNDWQPTASEGVYSWRGRQVYQAGENIWVHTTTLIDYAVCGYLLTVSD